jgi:hypothetical protein
MSEHNGNNAFIQLYHFYSHEEIFIAVRSPQNPGESWQTLQPTSFGANVLDLGGKSGVPAQQPHSNATIAKTSNEHHSHDHISSLIHPLPAFADHFCLLFSTRAVGLLVIV